METDYRPRVLVLGGANCVFEDQQKAQKLFTPDVVIAVNDVGSVVLGIHHWATMHPEKMKYWMDARKSNFPDAPDLCLWTARHKSRKNASFEWNEINSRGGGSGLLGARVAKFLGSYQIVLAGIPMVTEEAHFFNPKPWTEVPAYKKGFIEDVSIKPFIRSMSGWTQEYFGGPSTVWLGRRHPWD